MRITEIHVDGYGIWRDLRLAQLDHALTVVWGQNEAGKSTLMHFIRDMLFGTLPGRHLYLPPVDGGTAGGHLGITTPDATWQLDRQWYFDAAEPREEVRWHENRGGGWQEVESPQAWGQLDRAVFENVFCLGLSDLHQLDQLDAATAGQFLYSLSTGLDRTTLHAIHSDLQQEEHRLLREHEGRLFESAHLCAEARESASSATASARDWIRASRKLAECEAALERLEQERGMREQTQRHWALAVETAPRWQRLWALDETRRNHPLASHATRQQAARWVHLEETFRRLRKAYRRRRRRVQELRARIASTKIHPALWEQRRAVDALVDQQGRLIWLQAHVRADSRPAPSAPVPVSQTPEAPGETGLAPELWSVLQQQAAELRAARDERERLEIALLESPEEPASQQNSAPPDDRELDRLRDQVTQLRQRVRVKQRLDKMVRHRKELQEEIETLLEQQVLPGHTLAYLGIPFVVGVMLILTGIFWRTASMLGWPIALLGLVGWLAAIAIKVVLEKSASQDLEEAQDQLAALERQIAATKKEAAELDEHIPTSAAPLEERLEAAEWRLAAWEGPVAHSEPQQSSSHKSIQRQLEAAETRCRQAQQQWQALLRKCGLAEDLGPEAAASVPVRSPAVPSIQQVIVPGNDEALHHEYELMAGRIRRLAMDLLEATDESDPVVLLDRLHGELTRERRRRARRRRWHRQVVRLRRQMVRLRRHLRRLESERRAVVEALQGATIGDDIDFQKLWHDYRDIETKYREVTLSLEEQLGSQETWQAVEALVRDHSPHELQVGWEEAQRALEAWEGEKAEWLEQKGRWQERRRQLEVEPVAEEAVWRCEQAESAWQKLAARAAAVAHVREHLARIQKRYEHDRQPATLQDASRYFHFLTQKRYDRVWTPWDEPTLRVETAAGEQRTVEQLSTGTRELLFVALRLAIVAHYARQGIRLPLILDDVLVNLDRQRCQAACRLLAAFSEEGHQLLFLTCHDHIAAALEEAGATIVALPGAAQPMATEDSLPRALPEQASESSTVEITETILPMADTEDSAAIEELETGEDEEAWLDDETEEEPLEADVEPETAWEESYDEEAWSEDVFAEELEWQDDETRAEDAEAELDDETDRDDSDEEPESDEGDVAQDGPARNHRRSSRFTWDSPERWKGEEGEAA